MSIQQPMIDTHEIIGVLQKKYKCSSETAKGIVYVMRKFYFTGMENVASKEQLDFVKESLENQLGSLATKEDLMNLAIQTEQKISRLATKEDLVNLAIQTEQKISKLATKEEISKLATKEEISKLATKEEVAALADQIKWLRWMVGGLFPFIGILIIVGLRLAGT